MCQQGYFTALYRRWSVLWEPLQRARNRGRPLGTSRGVATTKKRRGPPAGGHGATQPTSEYPVLLYCMCSALNDALAGRWASWLAGRPVGYSEAGSKEPRKTR